MNTRFVITACSAAVLGLAISFSAPAVAQDAKACGKQWNDMTKDQKKGLKKKDFVSGCVAKAAPAPATETKKETKKEAKETKKEVKAKNTPAGKPGRQAMIERERACGKEWRENKAAGKIEKGQTWPKYWSACNTRMKAQGM
jgi:hypothetical protein